MKLTCELNIDVSPYFEALENKYTHFFKIPSQPIEHQWNTAAVFIKT